MRNRPEITILVDPVPCGFYRFWEPVKRLLRRIKRWYKPIPFQKIRRYRGHHAVTRSMVEGLRKIGIHCTYNPQYITQVSETVLVPGGLAAAKQAIRWKRTGFVRKLILGTNLVDFPSENEKVMCAPEVDFNIVPSDWVRDNFINDKPELKDRVFVWPAGVDTEYWSPDPDQLGNEILIFTKDMTYIGPSIDIEPYFKMLEEREYLIRVLKYGTFTPEQYLKALRNACLMVGFSLKETQGIAWVEAWAVNVPTLIYRQDKIYYKGRHSRSSTCPYLSNQTGIFFRDLAEFDCALRQWQCTRSNFAPRQWVLRNMSDVVRCSELCKLAGIDV
jgi:hypothetical protein